MAVFFQKDQMWWTCDNTTCTWEFPWPHGVGWFHRMLGRSPFGRSLPIQFIGNNASTRGPKSTKSGKVKPKNHRSWWWNSQISKAEGVPFFNWKIDFFLHLHHIFYFNKILRKNRPTMPTAQRIFWKVTPRMSDCLLTWLQAPGL